MIVTTGKLQQHNLHVLLIGEIVFQRPHKPLLCLVAFLFVFSMYAPFSLADSSIPTKNLEAAHLLMESAKFEEGIAAFEKLASESPVAQYMMGFIKHRGVGCEKDMAEALEWYKKAAEAGNIEGKLWYGRLLLEDEKQKAKGIQLIEDAAHDGYIDAQAALSSMYYWGKYVEIDYEKARIFSFMAAAHDHGRSQLILSYIYSQAKGVKRDAGKGLYWLKRAAESNDEYAQYLLGMMYQEGISVEKDASLAKKYLTLAALKGVEEAQVLLNKVN